MASEPSGWSGWLHTDAFARIMSYSMSIRSRAANTNGGAGAAAGPTSIRPVRFHQVLSGPFDHGAPSSASLGFEQSATLATPDNGLTAPFYLTILEVRGKKEQLTGALPDILTDDAMKFVEANRHKPFALSLHYRAPHLSYGPVPEVDSAPFNGLDPAIPTFKGNDDQQVKRLTRDYYASVHSIDRNLGRLLAHLDTRGLAEKTIIAFTSDHGYNNTYVVMLLASRWSG